MPVGTLRNLGREFAGKTERLSLAYRRRRARYKAPESLTVTEAVARLLRPTGNDGTEGYLLEFYGDERLVAEHDALMLTGRGRKAVWPEWAAFLYATVRTSRPGIVFETGVFDGRSSAAILAAMSRNNFGTLVSVDLPARAAIEGSTDSMPNTTLPPGRDPGWAVPSYLRQRYRLFMGDSRALLPEMFAEFPEIDIFVHDSLHTFEHQRFEYELAWPHLNAGGLLLSDDIFWSAAFHEFCTAQGRAYVRVGDFGAVRK